MWHGNIDRPSTQDTLSKTGSIQANNEDRADRHSLVGRHCPGLDESGSMTSDQTMLPGDRPRRINF